MLRANGGIVMACVCLPVPDRKISSEFQLKSILLPTDFSEASDRAADLARGLARQFRSTLHVVHAVWQKEYEWDEAVYHTGTDESCGLKRSQEFVAAHALDALPHESTVLPGSPAEVIQLVVAEKQIDLVVLGTHGVPWSSKFLFGANSERIYREARCPVLAVGPRVRAEKCSGDFKSIIFAMDPESDSMVLALDYALELALACEARLTVACMMQRCYGANGKVRYELEERWEQQQRAQILRLLDEMQFALPHPPDVVVKTGQVSQGIIQLAADRSADLIVKGRRPPLPHPATGYANPISVNAPCPVLTVRGTPQA